MSGSTSEADIFPTTATGKIHILPTPRVEAEALHTSSFVECKTEVSVEIDFSWTEPARVKVADEEEPSKDDEAVEPTDTTPHAAS
ncbi:hypothetical protein [Micromonospora arida]